MGTCVYRPALRPLARRARAALAAVCGLLLAATAVAPARASTPPVFTATDLGTLGADAHALGLNNLGQVVGVSWLSPGVKHGFLWDHGKMVDLGTLGGLNSSAEAINDAGQIVGSSELPAPVGQGSPYHAFLNTGGSFRDLGTFHPEAPPDQWNASGATAVNAAGHVAGSGIVDWYGFQDGNHQAFFDAGKGMQNLGGLPGLNYSQATGMNASDQVVGYAYDDGSSSVRAFLWQDGVMRDLTPPGSTRSEANGINDAGQIIGAVWLPQPHAYLWDSAGGHDLGVLYGDTTIAYGINNLGQIIGGLNDAYNPDTGAPIGHFFLYTGGVTHQLNDLILPDGRPNIIEVIAINDRGQILVNGLVGSVFHAYLLNPLSPTDPRGLPPAAPTGLTVRMASKSELDLTWTDNSSNETGFEIQRQAAGGDWTKLTVTAAKVTTFHDTGLDSFAHYTYRVRALGIAGNSDWSAAASGDTGPPAALSVSVSGTLDLGRQSAGAAGGVQRVLLTNSGGSTLFLGALTLSGADPGDFLVIPSALTIPGGGQATLTVVFTPTALGTRSALLTIPSSAAGAPPTLTLTGNAAGPLPASGVAKPAHLYAATDLGPTEMFPDGMAINEAGQVAWTSGKVGQFDRAFVYDGGGMRPLTMPASLEVVPGYSWTHFNGDTAAYGINASGQVAGFVDWGGASPHAVVWDGAGVQSLNPLIGDAYSVARAINDAGEVAGYGEFAEDLGKEGHHAFLYDGASMHNLGALPGDKESYAYGINNAGQVVGRSGNQADWFHNSFGPSGHAFLYDRTGMHDLGALPGDNASAAYAINDAGQVFGMSWSSATEQHRPFMVDSAGMHGPEVSWAAPGGTAPPPVAMEGSLWYDGAAVDVSSRLAPGSNVHLLLVHGVNGQGQIAGEGQITGMENGPMHAFLLTPIPAAAGRFSPASVTFGEQPTGSSSVPVSVTLTNIGELPLTIKKIALSGYDPGDFTITRDSGETTLAPGAVRTLQISFTPTAVGTREAALGIVSDDLNAAPVPPLPVSGEGTAPVLRLDPAALGFGSQPVDSSSEQTVTMTNGGTAPLSIRGISTEGPNAAEFSVIGGAGSQSATSLTLAPGESRILTVRFAPAARGPRGAALVIATSAPDSPARLDLTGTGIAPVVSISPSHLDFGPQPVGMVNDAQALTLQNTGDAPLRIDRVALEGVNPNDFSITADGWTGAVLPPGQVATLNLRFTPTTDGSRTAQLVVTDNAPGGPQRVPLAGTGATPALRFGISRLASPGSVEFGSAPLGTSSAPQTVTLTNSGTAPLTISGITLAGGSPHDYQIVADSGEPVLPPGASRTLTLRFTPTAAGARGAVLTLTDNAAAGPQSLILAGSGVLPGSSSAGPAPLPTGARLIVTAIDGSASPTPTLNSSHAVVVSVGQSVTLQLLLQYANGSTADVSGDPNCHFGTGAPVGTFTSKTVWQAGAADAGRTVVMGARYRSPVSRQWLAGTVTVTVKAVRRRR